VHAFVTVNLLIERFETSV